MFKLQRVIIMSASLISSPLKKGYNFRIIQRRNTSLGNQNIHKAEVLNQFIGNMKAILAKEVKLNKLEEQKVTIQTIVRYIKDTIYGDFIKEPKLEIEGVDEVTISSLQDQIQYLCANDGYFACGHQEVTRGTIKMLYNL